MRRPAPSVRDRETRRAMLAAEPPQPSISAQIDFSWEDLRESVVVRSDCIIIHHVEGCRPPFGTIIQRRPWRTGGVVMANAQQKLANGAGRIDFQTAPSRYRHWKLVVDGTVATLIMDVDEKAGL